MSLAIACLALGLVVRSGGAPNTQAEPEPNVQFRWALAVMAADRSVPTPVSGDVRIGPGDRLKAYLSPRSAAFIYVLVESPSGHVQLLFPKTFTQFSEAYLIGSDYYGPAGEEWLSLDQKGETRLHVLASRSRLTRLEALLEHAAQVEPLQRLEIAARIADEIRDLKKRHRNLRTSASRPLPMGGAVRSPPTLKGMAREIRADRFFATTYVIGQR